MSASFAGKLTALVRELGSTGALCYVLHRAGAKSGGLFSVHRYHFVVQPVAMEPLLPPRRGRSIAVRQLSPQDPYLLALPLDANVRAFRMRQGALCFAAFKDDLVIGCLWLCLSCYDEDEVRCRYQPMPAGAASWDFDVYVDPAHRSGPAFGRLWDEANAFLRQHGVTCSWSRISAFNPASLASHARLGARIAGRATYLRIGPCQFMIASLPPYRHLSFQDHKRPLLVLSADRPAPITHDPANPCRCAHPAGD